MEANPHIINHGKNNISLLEGDWSQMQGGLPTLKIATTVQALEAHQGRIRELQQYAAHVAGCAEINLISAEEAWRNKHQLYVVDIRLANEVGPEPAAEISKWRDEIHQQYDELFQPPKGVPPTNQSTFRIETETILGGYPYRQPYRQSQREKEEFETQIMKLLENGWVTESRSRFAAPVIFVKKHDGSLRMCVDYRALNKITIKDRYPLPYIDDLLDSLHGSKIFTKLDLASGYHQLPIHPEDRHKTAFVVPGGLYEWKVIPFGLANAPAAFMRHMHQVLKKNAKYCAIYLDDILIHSQTLMEHKQHVAATLDSIRKARLKLSGPKCEFGVSTTTFVGFRVSEAGVHAMEKKIDAITTWPAPLNARELRGFLGLAGYYRKFVDRFAHRSHLLYDLLSDPDAAKNATTFRRLWHANPQYKQQMLDLKQALSTSPVLATMNPQANFILRTDASDTALGGVLAQLQQWKGRDGKIREVERPLGFFSRKLSAVEMRYPAYDRELLAIHDNLQHWSCYVHCRRTTTIYTDHSALQHILKQPKLSSRQWRHLGLLQQHDYEIRYFPGASNIVADALSRRAHPRQNPLDLNVMALDWTVNSAQAWIDSLGQEQRKDDYFSEVIQALENEPLPPDASAQRQKFRKKAEQRARLFVLNEDEQPLLLHRRRRTVCIPHNLVNEVLREAHDTPTGGHFGVEKTLSMVSERFYWPGMSKAVVRWIQGCAVCQRVKPSNHLPYGLLQPLDIPAERWSRINVDFITKLPDSEGCDTIVTIIDALTKRSHWFATTEATLTAQRFAELFVREHIRLHGVPASMVSDRDSRFTSEFWRSLMEILGTKVKMSTAFHPQSDGQAEKANSIVETYLRAFASTEPTRWKHLLPLAEFAYNSARHSATKLAPFEADLGYIPRLPIDIMAPRAGARDGHMEARTFAERLRDILSRLQTSLEEAQCAQIHESNKKRMAHNFKTGDQVMLDTSKLPIRYANLSATASRKLQHKHAGPFTLGLQYGENAFEIVDLPQAWRVHNTFNVSRFKRCTIDHTREQQPPPPLLSTRSGQQYFNVEAIRRHTGSTFKDLRYEVKWEGYPESANTWEPMSNLKTIPHIVREYHERAGLRVYSWMTAPDMEEIDSR